MVFKSTTQRFSSNRFQFLSGSQTRSSTPEQAQDALETAISRERDDNQPYPSAEAAQTEAHRHPTDIHKADGVMQGQVEDSQADSRLPHDASIFVANLPTALQDTELEDMLKSHFRDIANVTKVKIIHNPQTTIRCAFLQCKTPKQAQDAVAILTNSDLGGSTIRCEAAKAHRALFISSRQPEDMPTMESVGLRRAIGSRHIDVFVNQEAGSETKLPHSPVSPDSPYSADSAVVTFNSASGYPIESVRKLVEFFGPIAHLHPHRSSWHPNLFLPHPPPLPLHLPINGTVSMDFVGPWEVKFESRDDAICAKRTLEQIPNLLITWVHAHPRPFGRPRGPWPQALSDGQEAGFEERPQPVVPSKNPNGLLNRSPAVGELSAADLRDSFKFAPRLPSSPFDRQQPHRIEMPKQRSEPAAAPSIPTLAPRMTEVEFPPLDDVNSARKPITADAAGSDRDLFQEGKRSKIARQSFAKVVAPVSVVAENPSSETPPSIRETNVAENANATPVTPVEDGKCLYIPHLSKAKGWTVERLGAIFSRHEGFEKAILKSDNRFKKRGQKTCRGLIDFDTHEHAAKAMNAENGQEHFDVVFQLAYHKLHPRKDVSSTVQSITPAPLAKYKAETAEEPAAAHHRVDEPPSATSKRNVAIQTGDRHTPEAPPIALERSPLATAVVEDPVIGTLDLARGGTPNNPDVEPPSSMKSPFITPQEDVSLVSLSSLSSPITVKPGLSDESSAGPTPVKHHRTSKPSHCRSSSDSHVHFKLPASVLNATKAVEVAQSTTQERRASAGRETIGRRDVSGLVSSPLRLGEVESGKGKEGASAGRRTPSWGTTMEESGLSSPEARSVTSSDAETVEIVSGGEGQQPVTEPGLRPYEGLVYMLPPSNPSRNDGHPRQVPQAKGFVDTEHGLLPIYSPEALAPYAREAFLSAYPPVPPADMPPWAQHMPTYAPGWGSGGYWMPGMGMPTPATYGTTASGSPVIPPPFPQQQVPNYSHGTVPSHNQSITPSTPAFPQASPRQPPAGRGRHQSSQYRRNNSHRNHQQHQHQHQHRHHQSEGFDPNSIDPALYYQYQYQYQNSSHQNQNQHQHSPPQYNLNQQHPYYMSDQHAYLSAQQQQTMHQSATSTEAMSPAYV